MERSTLGCRMRLANASSFFEQARAFATIHAGRDAKDFVRNANAKVDMVRVGDLCVPVTVAGGDSAQAWIVSPRTTYGNYAGEEALRLAPPWSRPALQALTRWADRQTVAAGLDRAVSVNNWLLSTNLYPSSADPVLLESLLEACLERWPGQALWLRSLNVEQHQAWLAQLRRMGFILIPTRQVYLFSDLHQKRHANLQRDLALLRKTRLRLIEHDALSDEDLAHGEQLYAKLYLQKYSRCNPAYTAGFLRAWHRSGLLRMSGWRNDEGRLQGIVGIFAQHGVSTAPIVGYDTALPRSLGLYRLLMARVFEDAMETGSTINLSAGASHFKRLRGGMPAIEYSAVYCRHLPAAARRFLHMLRAATCGIGVPLMKWLEL